jgi:hypothetical protein
MVDEISVAVISDLNSAYGSTTYEAEVATAVAQIVKWQPDLVLIAGDMVAGQRPALTDEQVRAMWRGFDDNVAAPFRRARIPFAFTLGNHDGSAYPAHARDRRIAEEYWRDSAHVPALRFVDRTAFPRYYAFAMGELYVAVLDASTGDVWSDTVQLAWLRGALSSRAAQRARMRMVLGHVPLYAVAEGRNQRGEVQARPEELRGLLDSMRVRLHVSGHHHAYYPAIAGDLLLLHAGAAGAGPRPLIGSAAPPYKTITLLRIFPALDSIEDRTWRIDGEKLTPVDPRTLPARIDGINGTVRRR